MKVAEWVSWRNARDAAATGLCVVGIWLGVSIWRQVNSVGAQLNKVVAKTTATMEQVDKTAFELHAAAKAWKEELGDPEAIRSRNKTQLALAALAEHAAYVTLPKLDKIPDEVAKATTQFGQVGVAGERLISGVDQRLNNQLMPEITAGAIELRRVLGGIQAVTTQTGADAGEVLKALNELLVTARTTPELVNARLEDLGEFQAELQKSMAEVTGVTQDIHASTMQLPAAVKFAVKWNKPLTYARLVSILAGIFRPY